MLEESKIQMRYAIVCRYNINRSVQVHRMMSEIGFTRVESYGTEKFVSLPGAPQKCNSVKFDFGTRYEEIFDRLVEIDQDYYRGTAILKMLESNIETKPRPQRFQSSNVDCDVIITLDPNSRDSVLDELSRRNELKGPVHLIHVPIQDQLVRVKEDSHHVAVLAMMLQESSPFNPLEVVQRFNETFGNYSVTYDLIR